MRFYLGPLSAPEHKGQFLLIVPEETLDDYSFTAYWTLDGTPDFYSGTFSDVQFDNVSRFPVKSVHHGEKGSFFFDSTTSAKRYWMVSRWNYIGTVRVMP